jgi:hypothetical protein
VRSVSKQRADLISVRRHVRVSRAASERARLPTSVVGVSRGSRTRAVCGEGLGELGSVDLPYIVCGTAPHTVLTRHSEKRARLQWRVQAMPSVRSGHGCSGECEHCWPSTWPSRLSESSRVESSRVKSNQADFAGAVSVERIEDGRGGCGLEAHRDARALTALLCNAHSSTRSVGAGH